MTGPAPESEPEPGPEPALTPDALAGLLVLFLAAAVVQQVQEGVRAYDDDQLDQLDRPENAASKAAFSAGIARGHALLAEAKSLVAEAHALRTGTGSGGGPDLTPSAN